MTLSPILCFFFFFSIEKKSDWNCVIVNIIDVKHNFNFILNECQVLFFFVAKFQKKGCWLFIFLITLLVCHIRLLYPLSKQLIQSGPNFVWDHRVSNRNSDVRNCTELCTTIFVLCVIVPNCTDLWGNYRGRNFARK